MAELRRARGARQRRDGDRCHVRDGSHRGHVRDVRRPSRTCLRRRARALGKALLHQLGRARSRACLVALSSRRDELLPRRAVRADLQAAPGAQEPRAASQEGPGRSRAEHGRRGLRGRARRRARARDRRRDRNVAVRAPGVRSGAGRDRRARRAPGSRIARELARERGIEERTSFRVADVLESPESVEEADVVLLNRVVCCSPDGIALAGRAAGLTRRTLVLSFPRDVLWVRAGLRLVNIGMRRPGPLVSRVSPPSDPRSSRAPRPEGWRSRSPATGACGRSRRSAAST